jgi:transposase
MQTKVRNNLFDGQSFYVGIDYHKKNWKVTILGDKYEHKTMTTDPKPEHLVSYLNKHFPGGNYYAVYESGFSGFSACRRLNELGVNCIVTHAADVPTSQKDRLQKTDKADSRKLAKALRSQEVKGVHVPDPIQEADRALLRQKGRITKDISRIKNRVKSLLFQFDIKIPDRFTAYQTRHWSKVYINWLRELTVEQPSLKLVIDNYLDEGLTMRKQLLAVNRQIRKLSQSERYKKWYELLTSMPGIGVMTAMNFLVQVGDVKRFIRFDQLCNYVGLVPSMHGSGDKMKTGKLIKRGRKDLKIQLIEASWVAVRQDPAMMAKFNELIKVMPKNKAIIRIARKMLNRLRRILATEEKYVLGVVK